MATRTRSRAKHAEQAPALARRFEAVLFDWDGTAVPDRAADASRLRELVEELCALGLELGVVTGTHVGNVDGQLGARPSGPGRLYFCVNRGSEVFRADEEGLQLVYRREATPEEDAALDAAADATVEALARRGIRAEIVSQRLNRRKIDLIPEPEWYDPPKARIAELFVAVEERLRAAGFEPPPDEEVGTPEELAALRAHGRAVRLGRDRHIHPDALAAVRERVEAAIARDGAITIAGLRDELGTSRRHAQALLEALDAARVTLRRGDERVLRRRRRSSSR
jgi:hypothetical protein